MLLLLINFTFDSIADIFLRHLEAEEIPEKNATRILGPISNEFQKRILQKLLKK